MKKANIDYLSAQVKDENGKWLFIRTFSEETLEDIRQRFERFKVQMPASLKGVRIVDRNGTVVDNMIYER